MASESRIFTPADIANYSIGTTFIVCQPPYAFNTRDDVDAFYVLHALSDWRLITSYRSNFYNRFNARLLYTDVSPKRYLLEDQHSSTSSSGWKSDVETQIRSLNAGSDPRSLRVGSLKSTFILYKAPSCWVALPLELKVRFLQWRFWTENSRPWSELRLKDIEGKVGKPKLVL
jgi:hypothetical protein